jgi:hypothetical protein
MFMIINGLVRNIIILYRKNINIKHDCLLLLKQIMNLENIFNNKYPLIGNKNKYRHMINNLLKNFEHNFIVPETELLPFICIPAPEYEDDNTFKLLIWYVLPNIYDIDKLYVIINNIKNYINNNTFSDNIFRNLYLNSDDIKYIYGFSDSELNIIKDNYFYNISCIIDENGRYKFDINLFKEYLTYICKLHNIEYNYVFYHYPTGYDTSALHFHVFKKYSTITSTNKLGYLSSIITTGHKHNFSHIFARYVTNEFNKFNGVLWKTSHIILYTIPCIHTYITYINNNNYVNIFNKFKKDIDSKIYDKNTIIEFLIKFQYNCMKDNILSNENTFELSDTPEIKSYFKHLYNFNNNFIILIQNINELLEKYISIV